MALDLIIRNARLPSSSTRERGERTLLVDIGVRDGIIAAIAPKLSVDGPAHDAQGKIVSPGLIESHFHLDKALTIDRVPYQPNRAIT
jgi:cytosine deaminase